METNGDLTISKIGSAYVSSGGSLNVKNGTLTVNGTELYIEGELTRTTGTARTTISNGGGIQTESLNQEILAKLK